MSQDIPAPVSKLKETANALFMNKCFAEANNIYQSIIEQQDNLSVQLIRIMRSNRAACFIELGDYPSAIAELDQIFQPPESGPTATDEQNDPIFQKVHFRKAICLFELAKDVEALNELDKYRDLVNGRVHDAEPGLRAKIVQSIIIRSPNLQEPTASTTTSTPVMRPFVYEVRVIGADAPISLDCTAPSELFSFHPSSPREAATAFLEKLVREHDRSIMKIKPGGWRCWNCSKRATSLTHTPTMYLHLSPEKGGPKIIDLVQPVCKNLSPCDLEARQIVHEELTGTSRMFT